MDLESKKEHSGKKQDVIDTAIKRFKIAEDAESAQREAYKDDLEFRSGKQWPDSVVADRSADNRPCLTINKLPNHTRQVVNDLKQNTPRIIVNPSDDEADIEVAEIYQGIIRHVEVKSDADVAYDTAAKCAVEGSYGYFRIITQYCDPMTFDQELKIERIRDPLTVYFDPSAQDLSGSDARWCFITTMMPRSEFEMMYPDADISGTNWGTFAEMKNGWIRENEVRVAEYYCKEMTKKKIVLLSDGQVIEKPSVEEIAMYEEQGLFIEQERETFVPEVKWYKLNGHEILEETVVPSPWIPVIPVYGDELVIDGVRILESLVRHAKDPQRMYNYWASAETETIALAPKSPWIAAEGQLEPYQSDWESANVRNHAYLKYKPQSHAGQPLPPPTRNVMEPPVQAITQARMLASDDLKSTTAIYDSALGNVGNETSGIAIQRRANQSQTSNFHFADNLAISLRHAGRVMVAMIPHIYDTPRTLQILGADGEEKIVRVNERYIDPEDKKEKYYNLGAGKYDVVVETGPGYATKRQEAVQSMLGVIQANPTVANLIMDLMVKNMDWPGAQEIAARLKRTVPPEVLAEEGDQQVPPQVQAQMQQMQQMVEQLTAELQKAQDDLDTKRMELESKERIELLKLENNLEIERAKLDSAESRALLSAQIQEINQRQAMMAKHFEQLSTAGEQLANVEQPTGGPAPGTNMME